MALYDDISNQMYPVYESIEVETDRILLALIDFEKTGSIITDAHVFDTYTNAGFSGPILCTSRSFSFDLLTLPSPVTYYLGGWGPFGDGHKGNMHLGDFIRAQIESGRDSESNLLLQSPNGKRWLIRVNDSGTVYTIQDTVQQTSGSCP